MTVDKEALFKPRLPEATVDVPGLGPVRVRGLSRAEAMAVRELDDYSAIERRIVALALLDPVLTEDEVGRWQAAATAGELEPVTDKISELSGMTQDAAKAAYKGFDADPASEFRLPPSGTAGDDRGRHVPEDE